MTRQLRFGVAEPEGKAAAGVAELRALLAHVSPFEIAPTYYPEYDALSAGVRASACELAWAPPLVALSLARARAATALVALGRQGSTGYYMAIAVRADSDIENVAGLAGRKIGWVSRWSAAGYVFPRLYLRAHGVDPDHALAKEIFTGSHAGAADALARGDVDAIATFATVNRGTMMIEPPPHLGEHARLIASAGPIPSDVVVAAAHVSADTRRAVTAALLAVRIDPAGVLARLMQVTRFEPAGHQHFALLERWLGGAQG